MVARMQKMKSGNLGGIERHNQRTLRIIAIQILTLKTRFKL